MFALRVTAPAVADIEDVLLWSHERFGETGRRRYEALIGFALSDLAADPTRPTAQARPEIASEILTYHLRHGRTRVRRGGGIVHRPRHFIVFRLRPSDTVQVLRLLHDSMDLAGALTGSE
ncbi:MAG: type II toxin-antitoxin system RelE/ParE family toxin [Alphaproteobacteria bacterium]|nr:type II toxin-antitoxin system RelE/ParE family toxin [Alphaproteobacteria bacterium]